MGLRLTLLCGLVAQAVSYMGLENALLVLVAIKQKDEWVTGGYYSELYRNH